MKKLSIYLVIIVGIFASLYFVNQASTGAKDDSAKKLYGVGASKLKPATVSLLDDPNYQNIVLPSDLDRQLANKESGFVYFFSPECSHCRAVTPYLYPASKELGITLKQYNVLEFPQFAKYNVTQWPLLVYYKEGKEVERIVGENPEKTYRDFITKYK